MKKIIIFFIVIFVLFSTFQTSYACNLNTSMKLYLGLNSPNVKELQNCLIEAKYNLSKATGYYGSQTLLAVKNFYKDYLNISWPGKNIGPKGISKLIEKFGSIKISSNKIGYKYVKDENDLKKYINEPSYNSYGLMARDSMTVAVPSLAKTRIEESSFSVSRVSETNVQVSGIDEPDIIKTDGKNLFMSKPRNWYWRGGGIMPMISDGGMEKMIAPPYPIEKPKTLAISVTPPLEIKTESESIDTSGDMLLVKDKNILVVFSHPDIKAYDVKDAKNPILKWTYKLGDNTSIITSRLKDNQIYLITSSYLNYDKPCPFIPLSSSVKNISIPCNGILVPDYITNISSIYSVLKIDSVNGEVLNKVSIAEGGYNNAVSMFENNLYLATNYDEDSYITRINIYVDVYSKYFSKEIIDKIKKIAYYDISKNGKLNEIENVINTELLKLGNDNSLKIRTEAENSINQELKRRARELNKTKIVRISLSNLKIENIGLIPGTLINQFAIDEYNGHVRLATTVGESWGGNSANDIYVLNLSMKEVGSIKDLGLTERIYSVRFMGDKGYLVTFRQIDPFYVLDLKNPNLPKVTGELKIPGYSSYLHDLGNDLILGIGREGGDMKLSLFDVSVPTSPKEVSKYILKNNWSEVEYNHHAFLQDKENKVFFIPGSSGGYIFSYDGKSISLKTTVAGNNVKRAIYVNNYMYVISDEEIDVIDQSKWEIIKEFKFN